MRHPKGSLSPRVCARGYRASVPKALSAERKEKTETKNGAKFEFYDSSQSQKSRALCCFGDTKFARDANESCGIFYELLLRAARTAALPACKDLGQKRAQTPTETIFRRAGGIIVCL